MTLERAAQIAVERMRQQREDELRAEDYVRQLQYRMAAAFEEGQTSVLQAEEWKFKDRIIERVAAEMSRRVMDEWTKVLAKELANVSLPTARIEGRGVDLPASAMKARKVTTIEFVIPSLHRRIAIS